MPAAAASALRAGDTAGAIERLTGAASASPSAAGAHRVLGSAYRASGDAARALEELATAVRLDPADERARLTTAAWLAGDGRAGDALEPLAAAVRWQGPARSMRRWGVSTWRVGTRRAPRARFARGSRQRRIRAPRTCGSARRFARPGAEVEHLAAELSK